MSARNPALSSVSFNSDRSLVAFRVGSVAYQILVDSPVGRLLRATRDDEKGTHGPCWIDVDAPKILAAGMKARAAQIKTDNMLARERTKRRAFTGPGATY